MKKLYVVAIIIVTTIAGPAVAQTENPVLKLMPKGTVFYGNVHYANDTLIRHLLDIYVPASGKASYPLVVWLHGGGWRKGDKYSAVDYMRGTVYEMIERGYAVVSINYRYSSNFKFPAQIQDCNQALSYLSENAGKYHLDKTKIAVIGFSAGGHLAALLGLSNNNKVSEFYVNGKIAQFKIRFVADYYGINDLKTLTGPGTTDPNSGVQLLIGGKANEQPEKARKASPVNYIDRKDPPFFIVHGDKDQAVDQGQSIELSNKLNQAQVTNELLILPNAPHGGDLFDALVVRVKLLSYLKMYLK
ncbi:alpha/beta hydrolase [Mucilaginibacter pocheonensis]|uniref:Acetyl esterase/lipase n=1 Tax=Mucilaginibacter pocheonensis TaxID=398050 RepID=A0ABU1T9R3_9SPHI|nr:alpha/beta hydrolase [Mucilaginibacter pocheonensis]MDR6941565.1 acetyl esterase/lipase [Mucilaginibacter pocheonensis]